MLPGGHLGHHEDSGGNKFLYDNYDGKRAVVAEETESSESEDEKASSSSTTSEAESEELIRDGELPNAEPVQQAPQDTFICIDIDTTKANLNWLTKHKSKKHGFVWLSKKMQDKGKELDWKKLTLDEKKDFNLAEAKEISNVIISKALRNLTPDELKKLDVGRVMSMRWVLTRKSSGDARARLVVLGFQAHNITDVATSSPTMSKGGGNVLLAMSAAVKFIIKSEKCNLRLSPN